MINNTDRADKEKIKELLSPETGNIEIITVEKTGSTNDDLKAMVPENPGRNILYIAESQTKGKGRMGRSFYSPDKTGIYMSLLIHPSFTAEECTLITPLCAVATAEAIEEVTGISAEIKWVNDIFYQKKKIAGILTEASFKNGKAEYIIVGIGINLTPPEEGFPEEIKDIAGAAIQGDPRQKNELIAKITDKFMLYYNSFDRKNFVEKYRSRLFFLGEKITVISPSGTCEATAIDIDDMCRLKVVLSDGSEESLSSGEISVKI